MEELPSVVPVKTGIQVLLSGSWMPAYDREHDDLGYPVKGRNPHLTESVHHLNSKFLPLISITPVTSASPIQQSLAPPYISFPVENTHQRMVFIQNIQQNALSVHHQ